MAEKVTTSLAESHCSRLSGRWQNHLHADCL